MKFLLTNKVVVIFTAFALLWPQWVTARTDYNGQSFLVVRGDGNYPPNEMMVDGELKGLHIELLQAIAKNLNLKLYIQSLPWARAMWMARLGKADAISHVSKTPDREEFLHYQPGNILSVTQFNFVIHKDNENKIKYNNDLNELKKYTIAQVNSFAYGEPYDSADFLNKKNLNDFNQVLNVVAIGRYDMGIVKHFEYLSMANPYKKSLLLLEPPLAVRNIYLGFNKLRSTEKLSLDFAEELRSFKQTDEYRALVKKYLNGH